MASSKVPMRVNPPDITTLTKVASMASGQYTDVVSDGAYYQARAFTGSTPSGCYTYLYIYKPGGGAALVASAEAGGSGANVRLATELVYIPQGVKLHVTGGFNDTTNSGIFRAEPMQ